MVNKLQRQAQSIELLFVVQHQSGGVAWRGWAVMRMRPHGDLQTVRGRVESNKLHFTSVVRQGCKRMRCMCEVWEERLVRSDRVWDE